MGSLRVGRPVWFTDAVRWFHPGCLREPLVVAEALERLDLQGPTLLQARRAFLEPVEDRTETLRQGIRFADGESLTRTLAELWRATRDPGVADLLGDLSRACGDELGKAIRMAGRGTKEAVVKAFRAACREPQDPRWVDLVLGWMREPPFRFGPEDWDVFLELLDRAADPRALVRAGELATMDVFHFRERFGAGFAALGPWCVLRLREGYPSFARPTRALSASELACLDDVRQVAMRQREERLDDRAQEAELLHLAAAGDDGALAVLADLLTAREDPRGELFGLERLGRRRSPAQRARRDVLKKDWRRLVGELGPILRRQGLRFQRGLVVSATAGPARPGDRERILASADWAAVELLDMRPDRSGRLDLGWVHAPHARRLRVLTVPGDRAFFDLMQAGPPAAPVEEIRVDGWVRLPGAVQCGGRWPKLTRVVGQGGRYERAWIERELGVPLIRPTS